tara:strand:- start:2119 stop:2553 length:435 start_codon:yes stop_codon:yes gene_type:complete
MGNGGSIGFGVLTKSNIKFMNSLCRFLIEKEFVTLYEIYDEYMSKPKSTGGGGAVYIDEGRWGSIRPTKNQLAHLLNNRLPFITNEKYVLCNYYRNKPVDKNILWSLSDNWEIKLDNYKVKLNQNYNIKSMKKYHVYGGLGIYE